MANENQTVEYDVEGYEVITTAIMELLNDFPGLAEGDSITFSTLGENSGKSMFPIAGSIIESRSKDIIGETTEICQYPFYVICRYGHLNETRKVNMKEWLDNLGRWIEQKPIRLDETIYLLTAYPTLQDGRKFLDIRRTTPATLNNVNQNNTEDWVVTITARYKYQY